MAINIVKKCKCQSYLWLIILLLIFNVVNARQNDTAKMPPKHSVIPEKGYVPDSTTAVNIAKAIWGPIYGEDVLNNTPFVAKLVNDSIWTVIGSLPKRKKGTIVKGGVPIIEIRKSDCKIVRVSHGK